MNPNNKATAGAGIGGALGALLVWFGPQQDWFTLATPDEGAMVGAAFGMVFTYLSRFLPEA